MFAFTKLMQAMVASGTVSDPQFYLTTLLLNTSSTNGAQNNTFLDSSTNNFTITRNGNTTQGTFTPFSQTGWSNYLTQASNSLSVATNSSLASGTNSFTLEFWYFSGATGNGRPMGNGSGAAFGANNWVFASNSVSGKLEFYVYNYNASTAITSSTSTTVASDNQWHHIVLVRSSNTWAMFIDGTRQGSSVTSSVSFNGTSSGITIGASGVSPETATAFVGYLSNVRFVNGTAVYDPTQSSIIVPTSPLTAIANTSLLTCQSNRFLDTSTNAFAITVNGTPSVQAFSPFLPTAAYSTSVVGGSGYFDGSGDYLSVPDNAVFDFFTGDFTMEGWVYHTTAAATVNTYYEHSTGGPIWYRNAAGNLELAISGGAVVATSSSTLSVNAWNHIAVSRSGTTLKLFINGAQVASVTNSTNFTSTSVVTIGNNSSTLYFVGYISSFRVLKGTAQYTTAFTPPTAPLTAITNTSLLLSATNAGIYDSASKNVLETVGNAQVSTTQAKWGTTSMYFDGTGDYLQIPSTQNINLGLGNFTIELWAYWAGGSFSTYNFVFDSRGGSSPYTDGVGIATNITNGYWYVSFASQELISSTAATAGWQHIALVRNNGVFTLYINGTSAGTYTASNNMTNTTAVIGTNYSKTQYYWNGYIDDLRISKFARYTANFTPPTAALPLQ